MSQYSISDIKNASNKEEKVKIISKLCDYMVRFSQEIKQVETRLKINIDELEKSKIARNKTRLQTTYEELKEKVQEYNEKNLSFYYFV